MRKSEIEVAAKNEETVQDVSGIFLPKREEDEKLERAVRKEFEKEKKKNARKDKRFERKSLKKGKKLNLKKWQKGLIIGSLSFVGAAGIVFLIFALFWPGLKINNFSEEISIGYSEAYADDFGQICYGNAVSCEEVEISASGDEIDTKVLGNYERRFLIRFDGQEKELMQRIHVVDKKAPEISSEVQTVSVCPNGKIPDFEMKIFDDYDGEITEKAKKEFRDEKVFVSVSDSSGNESVLEFDAVVEDKIAPIISLNGSEKYFMTIDMPYDLPEPTVIDNCDDVELEVEGTVDKTKIGTYETKYFATDESGNVASVERTVVVNPVPDRGIIYLTFDDGPSGYTDHLLDILKKYNVKATFFVTGSGSDDSIRRMFNEGHAIGLHTFSHNYAYIYQNVNNFFEDLNKIQTRVENITGQKTFLMRFPGGSSNTVSRNYDGGKKIMSQLVSSVTEKGYRYFDWNVSSEDAGGASTADQVYNNTVRYLKEGGSSVVLQHDSKGFSVDAVERIIQYGQAHGYKFMKLDTSSFAAHHGVNN